MKAPDTLLALLLLISLAVIQLKQYTHNRSFTISHPQFLRVHDKLLNWRVGLTLYPHSLDPGKIGAQTTHLGIGASQKDQLAGLHTMDDSTNNRITGFAARISRVNEDWAYAINATSNNNKVDVNKLEEARNRLTELYQHLGGKHTLHDFGNLVTTFEEESQKDIRALRANKGLPLVSEETRRVAYKWVDHDTPRNTTEGEEGGGQGL
jgi:hypothetical protein